MPLELPAYQKKENWGAAETFYHLVALARPRLSSARPIPLHAELQSPRPTALGFRHRDDVQEVMAILARLGIDVNVVAPLGATPADLARLGEADFNIVLYPKSPTPRRSGWSGLSASR